MRILSAAALVAIALWIGGLLTLGAIVAPVVFRIVAAPASADAMIVVFRRFDSLAVGCASVVLAVEIARALQKRPLRRLDRARGAVAVAASALALLEAFAISPQ